MPSNNNITLVAENNRSTLHDVNSGFLPAPLTSFVGRVEECQILLQLLLHGRLTTITGPAGIGKTRLAIHLVQNYLPSQFNLAECYFVQLADLNEPKLLLSAITRAVGANPSFSASSELGRAISLLNSKENPLLILNNFEHLRPATSHILALLENCPKLKLLITSRAALEIYGETVYPLAPLKLAPPHHYNNLPDGSRISENISNLLQYDAITLFTQRAASALPGFSLNKENASIVASICELLEGLPLALEWAAARIALLPPQIILQQLQHTKSKMPLQAVLDWSYTLLSPRQQNLLVSLGIFRGNSNLAAIMEVCTEIEADKVAVSMENPDVVENWLLEDLRTLINNGLVIREVKDGGQQLYLRLRRSVYNYSQEKLSQLSGEKLYNLHLKHAFYYQKMAEEAETHFSGPGQAGWLSRLQTEYDNIRLALEWGWQNKEGYLLFVKLCSQLWRLWYWQSFLEEGLDWLGKAFILLEQLEVTDDNLQAKLLNGAGGLASAQGDYPGARAFYEQALGLYRQLCDTNRLGGVLSNLGIVCGNEGNYHQAQGYFEESLVLRRASGEDAGIAIALQNLGNSLLYQGKINEALVAHQESLNLRVKLEDTVGMAISYIGLGQTEAARHNFTWAIELFQQSIKLNQHLHNNWYLTHCLAELALIAVKQGLWERASGLFGAVETFRKQVQSSFSVADKQRFEEALTLTQLVLGEANFTAFFQAGQLLPVEMAIEAALTNLDLFGVRPKVFSQTTAESNPAQVNSQTEVIIAIAGDGTILIDGKALKLRGQQRTLFCYLYEKTGHYCSIGEIKKAVWGSAGIDFVTDENVHQLIRQVRRKIEKIGLSFEVKELLVYNPLLRGYTLMRTIAS